MGSICTKSPKKQQRPEIQTLEQTHSKDFGELNDATSPVGKNERAAISHENLQEFYKLGKLLGSGGFATGYQLAMNLYNLIVRLATSKQNIKKLFAVKSISKEKIAGKDYLLLRELTILKKLDHPNIIKFYEIYQDQLNFHLVMEHCDGGELLQFILENRELITESWIQNVMFQMASALNYLHILNICHRDIKPQNILLNYQAKSNQGIPECKLIDFGLSCLITEQSNFASKVGTLLYVAPEVLKGNYDKMCDIWALGIVLYVMLSGEVPYVFNNKEELYKMVKAGKIDWSGTIWTSKQSNISANGIRCLKSMLEINPKKRITAQELVNHSWFKNERSTITPINQNNNLMKNVFQKMYQNHYLESRFKKEVLKMMVNELNQQEIVELRNTFKKIDVNNSGVITFQDLQNVIQFDLINEKIGVKKDWVSRYF